MRSPVLAMLWENWRLHTLRGRPAAGLRPRRGIGRTGLLFGRGERACQERRRGRCRRLADHAARRDVAIGREAQWRAVLGRVPARLSVPPPLHASDPDGRDRRRRPWRINAVLLCGVVLRIRRCPGARPSDSPLPLLLCGRVDRGLPPGLFCLPMRDPEQSRPVAWRRRHCRCSSPGSCLARTSHQRRSSSVRWASVGSCFARSGHHCRSTSRLPTTR